MTMKMMIKMTMITLQSPLSTKWQQTKVQKMKDNNQSWFSFGCTEFRNEGGANLGNEEGGGDNNMNDDDGTTVKPSKYTMINPKDWMMHINASRGHINPVLYTGEAELLVVRLAEGDLEKMSNDHGIIHFHLFFKWLLTLFGKEGFFEFVAARMRNYMVQIMKDQSYRPCHFDPMDKNDFQVDHIARFFWC